jgi:hypothetical protein
MYAQDIVYSCFIVDGLFSPGRSGFADYANTASVDICNRNLGAYFYTASFSDAGASNGCADHRTDFGRFEYSGKCALGSG